MHIVYTVFVNRVLILVDTDTSGPREGTIKEHYCESHPFVSDDIGSVLII